MQEIVDFLTTANIMELATDPRAVVVLGVVFIVAVFMRWKLVLLLLFSVGGVLAVMRYTNPTMGSEGIDQQMVFFIAGIMMIAIVLIYFLFIRGD